ncbi:hypothetical protein DYI37_03325 [Fulvimarina endophytica]|uniref:Uncharacterized protein n=1 Tax=Fulvimarina endophytica TaxID=2293836 RepID=A0A371XB79_9HYPH|nr:hypothetical protein [Fulvimarina endophytica]RFC66487.1 hypothetical protein DYI37_03325 [Fulvimarina endophytica]
MGLEQLKALWERVNALGAPDTACMTDDAKGYCRAIGDVLAIIEGEIANEERREIRVELERAA